MFLFLVVFEVLATSYSTSGTQLYFDDGIRKKYTLFCWKKRRNII